MAKNLLFIYGTLLQTGNKYAEYLKERSVRIGSGCFKGYLYDIGNYPGAVHDPAAESVVCGTVVAISDPEVWPVLDQYEMISEIPDPSDEYVRKIVNICTATGDMECWVYLYNWPVDKHVFISDGDYLSYKASN
ncbi:gamma-glutamylcyclotransferase family protein [Hufsiella ginkgonis]|uniref:Gamma-glutamylcyclotransferase AIG2-like domain-containing protein n=1 Tax=Hufsiella ginkgonis TaxID=2695274 RepID=A0A7K1Y196_9SPHI|nr:gamma-glutamylcyclotransferase family protein [Hufsiella ginkgonis]MXV17025.1 hypothetical protein [Hufsiella ginkgonis]